MPINLAVYVDLAQKGVSEADQWMRKNPKRAAQVATLALAFFPTAFFLNAVYTEALFLALTAGAVPLGMAVAILRYRLYDADLVVNRTIVWLIMTMLVVLSVSAIVRVLSGVYAKAMRRLPEVARTPGVT